MFWRLRYGPTRRPSQTCKSPPLPYAAILAASEQRNQAILATLRSDLAASEQRNHTAVQIIVQSSEVRTLGSIEAAKTEMLLQLQVSLLTKQVEDLKASQPT